MEFYNLNDNFNTSETVAANFTTLQVIRIYVWPYGDVFLAFRLETHMNSRSWWGKIVQSQVWKHT